MDKIIFSILHITRTVCRTCALRKKIVLSLWLSWL